MIPFENILDRLTSAGGLTESLPEGAVRCTACGHRCLIREGKRGICKVRFNKAGELRVPWGYVAALNADPVEKKPFYHLLPGSIALTFGMLGCDFHCGYCQNWLTSQVLRDPVSDEAAGFIRRVSPEQIVEAARRVGAQVIASSYNEPLITSEWAVAVFKLARQAGMKCVYVSNGNATPQVLEYLQPHLAGMKIDLKSMQDKNYRQLGGVLKNVLDTIKRVKEMGLWLEVVTLVVPGFNDSSAELWEAARFLAGISTDIPWHVTAFHSDYKMSDVDNTPARTLLRAAEIGREAGLHFVYAGNLPGRVDEYETTFCPKCNTALVKRTGYSVYGVNVTPEGTCPKCGTAIAGIWPARQASDPAYAQPGNPP
ncbi:MAG TPA: AmmeMemoRadiSam system radical SAM enzyme [Anaerolineales bacterium]|nr:AmmeMemoRadiSam system radical SAM enzyme [Anaerolineales bacterium]